MASKKLRTRRVRPESELPRFDVERQEVPDNIIELRQRIADLEALLASADQLVKSRDATIKGQRAEIARYREKENAETAKRMSELVARLFDPSDVKPPEGAFDDVFAKGGVFTGRSSSGRISPNIGRLLRSSGYTEKPQPLRGKAVGFDDIYFVDYEASFPKSYGVDKDVFVIDSFPVETNYHDLERRIIETYYKTGKTAAQSLQAMAASIKALAAASKESGEAITLTVQKARQAAKNVGYVFDYKTANLAPRSHRKGGSKR